jgi:hypothetical protein
MIRLHNIVDRVRIKKISLAESFTNFTQSRFLRTKTSFAHAFLRCPQKLPFSQTKRFSFSESFTNSPQKPLFYVQKAFYSHKPFLVVIQSNSFLPSITHLYHP